jgi:uncharacterized membrane protein YhaH (DUF805 family)
MIYYFQALKNYANFKGRARRSEYWYYVCFNTIVMFAILQIYLLNSFYPYYETPTPLIIYYVATLIPTLAVGVRRMHDVGKSGWHLLIPVYNLILLLSEGTRGSNKYGEDPKYVIV